MDAAIDELERIRPLVKGEAARRLETALELLQPSAEAIRKRKERADKPDMSQDKQGKNPGHVTGQNPPLSSEPPILSGESASGGSSSPPSELPPEKPSKIAPRPLAPLKSQLADAWDGCGGANVAGVNLDRLEASIPLLTRLGSGRDMSAVEVFGFGVARFKSDERTRRLKLGLPILLENLEQWCSPQTDAPLSRGPGEVSRTFDESQNPEWANG